MLLEVPLLQQRIHQTSHSNPPSSHGPYLSIITDISFNFDYFEFTSQMHKSWCHCHVTTVGHHTYANTYSLDCHLLNKGIMPISSVAYTSCYWCCTIFNCKIHQCTTIVRIFVVVFNRVDGVMLQHVITLFLSSSQQKPNLQFSIITFVIVLVKICTVYYTNKQEVVGNVGMFVRVSKVPHLVRTNSSY